MKKIALVVIIVFVMVSMLTACSAGLAETPPAATENPTESVTEVATEVAATETPVVETTEVPTEVVATEAPLADVIIPLTGATPCDTPSIMASLDGINFQEMGLYLNTELGERMTYTSRSFLIPEKEWNVALTSEELKTVEETWQFVQVCVPDTTFARIFSGGFEQKLTHQDKGVLITLQPGYYEFKLRNGEIVLWYPNQDSFADEDLTRIIEQIKSGNFDIKSELMLFGVTLDLVEKIPPDFNVQTIPDVIAQ